MTPLREWNLPVFQASEAIERDWFVGKTSNDLLTGSNEFSSSASRIETTDRPLNMLVFGHCGP